MGRRLPPLNSLRVFEAAGRHLSFTQAGEELHVTQAAVSHQIRVLEEWLGVLLFQRLKNGLKLTEEGKAYLEPLTEVFDKMAEATDQLINREEVKTLNISTLSSFASIWLVPRLKSFRDQYPDLDVRVVTIDQEEDLLSQGTVDVDIRYGDGRWQHVHARKFLTENIYPVCSPALLEGSNPLKKLEDLKHHTLLHDVGVMGWKEWLEEAGVEGIDPSRGPGFTHSHLVIQAAINGEGVALGRGALVADALARGDLVAPFGVKIPCSYSYYVVSNKNASDQPKIRAFAHWLLNEAEKFISMKGRMGS
ncbi:transcriptional regulator GcvA [Luteithermobacter gelatinilyticus]|uniref:transcriptional regulator GcvA n=1 Tax=Luteithermobacter gelatinilyticus TaxID=2582913 RepID=UPI0011074F0F|nr:transcriptional regulator GcvA [Luteithermobacter gelatinilyticus]